MVLTGGLPGGAPVREQDLARQLGVSRTPVREALGRLVSEGLLTKAGHRTAHVFRPTLPDLLEIYDIRIPLESLAGRFACESADAAALGELEIAAQELSDADPGVDWSIKHEAFHLSVAAASGRPRLAALVRTLRMQSEPYVRFAVASDAAFLRGAEHDHAEILNLVHSRDGEGMERLITEHLSSTRGRVSELLERSQRAVDASVSQRGPGSTRG